MRKLLFIATVFAVFTSASGQNIRVDNSQTVQALVENYLVEGCVEISNIASNINGSTNGFSSFAFFERDQSNFPFQNGIMLSTGNANSGGNAINTNPLNDGDNSWGTDADLENALGITNTLNATSIEFDFVSISNLIQFNYILASEEYIENFPCNYSDGFAFLIKEVGTGDPYTNIALIPGTNIPVNTNTIHDEIVGFCPAENAQYFDGYSLGDTNYNGRTKVLAASANITPNVLYHIKLVIADQTDKNYDSAVFIQGNSFNPTVDLGPNVTTCATHYTLNADIQNPLASYTWYRNGSLISGENNVDIDVAESGVYTVEIAISINDLDCLITDEVIITLDSEQTADPISDYIICDDLSGDGIETFDLSSKDTEALSTVPTGNYNLTYHYSLSDAQNNTNSILNPIQNDSNPQTVTVRIEDIDEGCLAFTSFNLIVNELPDIVQPESIEICDDDVADGSTFIDLLALNTNITQNDSNLLVTYHYSQTDANAGLNAIPLPYTNINPNETVYIRVINILTGCAKTTTVEINVLTPPQVTPNITPTLDACENDTDGFEIFNLEDIIPEILQGLTGVTVTFHETADDAATGTNPIADPTNYQNINPNLQILYVRVIDDITGCATIVPIELHTNVLITGTNFQSFYECDDDSADGIATFNLEDIALNIINNLNNITVSFYESQNDLDNNSNPIDPSIPYEVSASPQTIYVNVASDDCSYQNTIDLIINPPILLNPIAPIEYCSTDDSGFTIIELAALDLYFTTGLTNVAVSYFETELDAEDNTNPLPEFFTNISNPQTLFARVDGTNTDCFDTLEFEINIISAPTITQPNPIIICDDDQDGQFIVDLTARIAEIVPNTNNLIISFHPTIDDANMNTALILTPSNYNASTETVYTRIESAISGCFAITSLDIFVNTVPELISISTILECENDGNLIAEFYFINKDDDILNGQLEKQVLYFESQTDANNRVNIIDKNSAYSNNSNPQTIFVRVENLSDENCFDTTSFDIEVGAIPLFNPPTNFVVCDDISNDGIEEFDLSQKILEISQGIPQTLDITFYTTFSDADNAINALPLNYSNTDNPQQLYVRIENGTYCHAVAGFGLNVIQVPSVNLPSAITVCDSDYDGRSTFDLTVSEFEILDVRNDDIIISYFETEQNLELDSDPILSPDNYTNTSNPQTVFVKVTNTISNCFVAIPLDLNVNLPPVINPIFNIATCEDTSAIYSLDEATAQLINDNTNVLVSYHLSNIDAQNNQNPLTTAFNYTQPLTTLYIRAENTISTCVAISSFNLIINANPIANMPANIEACDDDNDFNLEFDLSQQTSIILGSQNPLEYTVTYYESLIDAIDNVNGIQNLNYYAFDGQEFFARIENNTTGCANTTSFKTIVHRKPIIEIPLQVICLDNLPLTVYAGDLVNGDSYLWSTGSTSSETEISIIGTYSLTVTSSFGCQTTTTFDVIESEAANIEVTETVDFSDPNNIAITISGIGNYMYILDNGLPQTSNIFENVSLGYHTITIIDLNGCTEVTKEVLVIDAPKFMTPNDDGYFDTWHIIGIETLPGSTVSIFDRYGKLLKFLNAESRGWDGTFNGSLMPSTDYWYVADIKQGEIAFQVKGHFALKR